MQTLLVEHRRCWMHCQFKMPKLSRTTFTVVSMEMKMEFTMIHYIQPIENKMSSTEESVLPKTSSSEEIE